ncbi:hypothetical protein GCM10027059_13620 [Myceligenerans halotolerans]
MTRTRFATAALAVVAATLFASALPVPPAVAGSGAVPSSSARSAVAGGVAWGVEPGGDEARANFDYQVDPGAVVADSMIVRNTGTEPLTLDVYAADAYTTTEGVLDLRLEAEAPRDGGSWVSVGTAGIAVEPGAAVEVPFEITVPADATPGDHPAGVVTSLVTDTGDASLAVDRRLGIRINLRVSGEFEPSASVLDARAALTPSWNPFAGGTATVTYRLENTGNTRVIATDTVALTGPLGAGAVGLGARTTPEVVPGSGIVVERVLEDVPVLGWLTGTVTLAPEAVGLGAQPLDAVTVEFTAPAFSWPLIALPTIAAGVAVTFVLLRRARARRGESQM